MLERGLRRARDFAGCVGLAGQYHPTGFAAWSTPEFVVISGSHGRENQAVETAYEQRAAEVFHTAHGGAVRVDIDRTGAISVRSWRKSPW